MKKVMFLLLSVLFAASAIALEGSAHEVIPFEADGVKANSPIDVTSESSTFEQKYFNHFGYIAYAGDYVAGISYYGYNPGKELKRHVKIWMTERQGEWICMYDGDVVIPSGGSEDEHISLLNVSFDTPMQLKELFNFFLKIECTGETSEKPLYFEYNSVRNSPVARYAIMSELKYLSGTVKDQDGKPVKDAHVQLYNDLISIEGVTDAEGAYQVRVDQSNAVYMVSVTAPGYATYRIEFTDDAIRLKDASTVTEKDFVLYDKVSYKKEQRATLILPVAPNPAWGRYYRLDRREGSDFYFEREGTPQANVPYVIFPSMDFELNLGDYDLQQEPGKTVAPYPEEKNEYLESISGIIQYATFYGSYQSIDVSRRYEDEPLYFLDATPDCGGNSFLGRVGACRAYLRMLSSGRDTPNVIFQDNDDYRPFVEEGKVWTYHYYNDSTGKDFYESLMVSGDTVVDDKSYKKIVDVTTGRVDCAIREEGRKVYATYPHYSGEKLIYDFGLNVGDAFQLYDDNNGSDPNAWATVVSVDTIVVGSRAFRALDVRSNDMKGWPNWWVEGIGGEYGLTANCLLAGNSYCFSSCKLGEDTLFTNHDFQTLGTIPSIETQTAYYYYKGNKIPLTQNENKVVVSIPKEYDGVCKRIRANLPVLSTIKDGVFDSFIIPRSDFERLTSQDFWEEDAKSVVLTSSYLTEDNDEVFETPYLNVKLKKEDDADLLASYAEKYRLKIVGNDSFMPLWYILHVTPESEKSPLKCANEIFESGEFASAVPDLSSDDDFDLGIAYRPFIEDGKVWKVGTIPTVLGNPVQVVDYYYFDGDTIIGGKTCKQMMCQRYVGSDFSDTAPSLTKVGAWYEEDKKVYRYYARDKQFRLWYDFSADANDTLQIYEDHPPYIISPRKTGEIKGFKGIYRDVMMTYEGELLNYNISTWMEGVGNIAGPIYCVYIGEELYKDFLMSCTVGDEVIYLNDEYEDGATPEAARKDRIDFTHTIKIKPKSRTAREAEAKSLYGEYNSQQLGINLNALDEAYQVSITDEAGKVVYEKAVNAGSIVGLNIDISAYAKGRYTVTVENSNESFTGQFETQTTGIEENVRIEKFKNGSIYNLQGQRINSLRKGLNIINGQKVFVK